MNADLCVLQVVASVASRDGGPTVAALSLNKALHERGIASRLLTTDADGMKRLSPEDLHRLTREHGLNFEWHKSHSPRRFKSSVPLALAIRRYLPVVDVMHIHGHYLFSNAASALLAQQAGVPYVIQPHGVFEPYQRRSSRAVKAAYDTGVGRRILDGAAGFVFADETEAEAAKPVIREVPSFVVPLGAELEPVAESAPSWFTADLTGRKIITFLGRIAPKKRVDLLIDAMPTIIEREPDSHLLIAGAATGPLADDLRRRAAASSAATRITFLGEVVGGEKTFLLENSSVFALPSENENFAISVAEAMLAGCPAAVSTHVAMSRRVAAGEAGTVMADLTASCVAQGILEVLGDRSGVLSTNARMVGSQLTWAQSAKTIEAAYRSVLAGAQRR